jgi:hypothetical protein
MIADGKKTIETRTWYTSYRGPLLIVSSLKPRLGNLPVGKALCIVRVVNCRPMTLEDELLARCELYEGAFAWELADLQLVEQVDIGGVMGLYKVDDALIKVKT